MKPALSSSARPFDLVVWGATGFTGQLVAHYLVSRSRSRGSLLRWAIGGRRADRLSELKRELETSSGRGGEELDIGIVTGDSLKVVDMEVVASSTRVVVSTVGPFSKYGTPLVAACVKCGTHYADITGEAYAFWLYQWQRQSRWKGELSGCWDLLPPTDGVVTGGGGNADRG